MFILILSLAYCIYFCCNRGMSGSARGQQTRRIFFATLAAMLPIAIGGYVVMPIIVGTGWMFTYPLLYHLTHRRTSPDYENFADTTLGIYLIGLFTSLSLLATLWKPLLLVLSVVEFIALVPVLFLWVYFAIYGHCVDEQTMLLIHETYLNEIIEYLRSFRWWVTAATLFGLFLTLIGCLWLTLSLETPLLPPLIDIPLYAKIGFSVVYAFSIGYYLFNPRHGFAYRAGLPTLRSDVKTYLSLGKRYISGLKARTARLSIKPLGKTYDKPHTILLVIGESASRDYMSAFTAYHHDTTPWMRQMATDTTHTILFPNAYSSTMHTVQVLEKALTEKNQYNNKKWEDSCSIIDVAHALGYRVHWYSNQGHLGVFDTAVSIIAQTSDTAEWTKQRTGVIQFDKSLLPFLSELNPEESNLLILHLKGSHFNFQNRYPNDTHTHWGKPGETLDSVLAYENSLRYTDEFLCEAYTYCRDHLGLSAMVYSSDHATDPTRRRTPHSTGFEHVRIPLFVWLSDAFLAHHDKRAEALKQNKMRYFTNDLLYELMLGLFDVESNCFDPDSSLSYASYKYRREDLLTFDGKRHIAEDVT